MDLIQTHIEPVRRRSASALARVEGLKLTENRESSSKFRTRESCRGRPKVPRNLSFSSRPRESPRTAIVDLHAPRVRVRSATDSTRFSTHFARLRRRVLRRASALDPFAQPHDSRHCIGRDRSGVLPVRQRQIPAEAVRFADDAGANSYFSSRGFSALHCSQSTRKVHHYLMPSLTRIKGYYRIALVVLRPATAQQD